MNVGVIGCGAAGMMAAITAARAGHKVTIFEHNSKAGKKILTTGNGKCNFTNKNINASNYNAEARELFEQVYSEFTNRDALDFFDEIGITPFEKNGYYYPRSGQASSVVSELIYEINKLKIKLKFNVNITKVEKGTCFKVTANDYAYEFDRLIIATGSKAAPLTGADGSGYDLAKELGHTVITPKPALCGLTTDTEGFTSMSGVRCNAKVSLFINEELKKSEIGEIQFTDYGISGIAIFQLSDLVVKALYNLKKAEEKKVYIGIDFAPDMEKDKLAEYLTRRKNNNPEKSTKELLEGFVNSNVALYIAGLYNSVASESKLGSDTSKQMDILADIIKCVKMRVSGNLSFDKCQVCSGGIPCNELKSTLESKICDGLYFAGEIVDVNGDCGGYNLQWAWSSGAVAGSMK